MPTDLPDALVDTEGAQTSGTVRRRLPYLPAMEGVRGFALISEIVLHLGVFVVLSASKFLIPGAGIVMSIFFVLSGFFITVLLLQDHDRHGHIRFWQFWRARGRRVYPPMLLVLAVHWLIILYYHRSIGLEWRDDLWILTNTMDYRYAVTGQPLVSRAEMVILWSVSVEITFYLLWPFVVTGLLRYVKKLHRIVWVLVAIAVASTVIRVLEYRAWGDWLAVYFRFEGRLDAFAIGAILGFLWFHDRLPMRLIKCLAWPCWLAFIACFWLVRFQNGALNSWGYLVFNIASFVIIAACLDQGFVISRWLSTRVMVMAGRVSYSFYLVHIQVYMWVVLQRRYLPMWQQVSLSLGGTLVFGTIAYLLVERPFVTSRGRVRVQKPPDTIGPPPELRDQKPSDLPM
ncbi:MAG: acyltransferase [Actinobacteria bacterium]|nr:acyltransferase [Actinomycetota bacterium]